MYLQTDAEIADLRLNRDQLTREIADLQTLLQRKTSECVEYQASLQAARSEKDRVREDYEKRLQQVQSYTNVVHGVHTNACRFKMILCHLVTNRRS